MMWGTRSGPPTYMSEFNQNAIPRHRAEPPAMVSTRSHSLPTAGPLYLACYNVFIAGLTAELL